MKKLTKTISTKLTVRHETLRVLAGIELTRVAGGDTVLPRDSGAAMCPAPADPGTTGAAPALLTPIRG